MPRFPSGISPGSASSTKL
ncbi:hypothetical protein RLOC_00005497 [Lonchura striata]|uniref:Uncharacterized protein n=1 Tax=Lonchura striata TaxID=40157 RepID=A0A218VC98_9PASE|nr:hypothetical protein RLOC_00005497 [Lonchura striata domestica]